MQVEDALSSIGTNIGHKTIAPLSQSQFLCQFGGNREQYSQQGAILRRQVSHRSDMTPWNEQDVIGCFWIDVFKRDHIFILVDNFTWYLTTRDFAEKAVLINHSRTFPPQEPAIEAHFTHYYSISCP